MQYRRARITGGTYFFTVVTHGRRQILCQPENVTLLRALFREVMAEHPMVMDAFVLLPDHLHCIWTLPENDRDFSGRWRVLKGKFTRCCAEKYKGSPTAAMQRKKEQAVWQHRFWEHLIRDEQDFIRHVEYIHYNPVKHGLVAASGDWPYSSFHRYVAGGLYARQWGAEDDVEFGPGVGSE